MQIDEIVESKHKDIKTLDTQIVEFNNKIDSCKKDREH